jgi:hypothetical protein
MKIIILATIMLLIIVLIICLPVTFLFKARFLVILGINLWNTDVNI